MVFRHLDTLHLLCIYFSRLPRKIKMSVFILCTIWFRHFRSGSLISQIWQFSLTVLFFTFKTKTSPLIHSTVLNENLHVVPSMVPIINIGTGMCVEEKDFWVLRQKTTIIHAQRSYHKGCISTQCCIILLSQQHPLSTCKLLGAQMLLYYAFRHSLAQQSPDLHWAP